MSLHVSKNNKRISSVESWFELAPPKKGKAQWLDGRSAKELAKAFFQYGAPAVPEELHQLLSSHPDLGSVELVEATPEHVIALDDFRGEARNADLAGIGRSPSGTVAITVEAKADEPFGDTITGARSDASVRSKVPARIEGLSHAIFGRSPEAVEHLRYQLLHGTAASLIYAAEHGATAAVFAVLEFHGPSCDPDKLAQNARDLDTFVQALIPQFAPLEPGCLVGPIAVPGGGKVPANTPLLIGKAIRQV